MSSVDPQGACRDRDPGELLARLEDPAIRIVSLTVTEKGLWLRCSDRRSRSPSMPISSPTLRTATPARRHRRYLVEGLARRRAEGIAPFAPALSCDNLPSSGAVLSASCSISPAASIPSSRPGSSVKFRSLSHGRPHHASTDATYRDAETLTGRVDCCGDRDPGLRSGSSRTQLRQRPPAMEKAGALMVEDVSAYEKMKLRMLNGAHSLLAYLGYIGVWIRDVMGDSPDLSALTRRHERRRQHARPGPRHRSGHLTDELIARACEQGDRSPHLPDRHGRHRSCRSACWSRRWKRPAGSSQAETYAIAVAAWMRYAGHRPQRQRLRVARPRANEIAHAVGSPQRPPPWRGAVHTARPLPGRAHRERRMGRGRDQQARHPDQDSKLPLF